MKKAFCLLFVLCTLITISAVSAEDNFENITLADDNHNTQVLNVNDTGSSNDDSLNDSHNVVQLSTENNVSKFSAKDVTATYGKKTKFSVKVLNEKGKVLKNKLITFQLNSKKYSVKSDSNGVASITFKLNAGKYTVKYSVDNVSGSSKIKIKNYYKITIFKWKSGADITKNKRLKKKIPNSSLVRKIVKAARKGTPVIKFKGSKGKRIFITAGVHGSELPSQVAAMRLIKELTSTPINGTVYIMPFMNPKATAKNVRAYKGVNLNEVANVKGTISYKTVKLICKYKCSAYGDFHCTKPGGKPGSNVVMGTYKPTAQSATLAKYIAKKANVKYLIYKKAGVEYDGALEDMVSIKHIPAVTCEVISPHGKIAKGTPKKSLLMMESFLNFSHLL